MTASPQAQPHSCSTAKGAVTHALNALVENILGHRSRWFPHSPLQPLQRLIDLRVLVTEIDVADTVQ